MKVHEKLYEYALGEAKDKKIATATAGLKYSAVSLTDGLIGVSYTWNRGHCCGPDEEPFFDYEGAEASVLLEKILSEGAIGRSLSMALINALNGRRALEMPGDDDNSVIFNTLKVRKGTRMAMVGFFRPVVKVLEGMGVEVYISDMTHDMGSPGELYKRLADWAECLILTSTTIVNGTFDEIMNHCPEGLPVALLGPTTPMIPEVFRDYGIALLAGTAPDKVDLTMRLIRQGAGTPDFQKHAKKVYCLVRE